MIWRAKRWRFWRRALGLLVALSLVVLACLPGRPASARQQQLRLPPQAELLAAASTPRQIAAVQPRLLASFVPVLVASACSAMSGSSRPALRTRRRDGSLPPERHCYRRVVHDDRSDQPA